MAGKLRFRGMTLPGVGTYQQKFFHIPVLPGATGRRELSGWNDCRMAVPATWEGLSALMNGTLVQVLDGNRVIDEFIPARTPREFATAESVMVTGPQLPWMTQRIGVYPPDFLINNPSKRPNWIWGGVNAIRQYNLGDLGSLREVWELYLSGEKYTFTPPGSGDFTFTIGSEETDDIDHEASAGTIRSRLEALDGIEEVIVTQDEDSGVFTIVFRDPNDLGSNMTASGGTLTKINDGFDTGSATFTLIVTAGGSAEQTEEFDWDASAQDLEGSVLGDRGLQGLSNVNDVTVSGDGYYTKPWVITFYDPPDPDNLQVMFDDGTAVLTKITEGGLDPSPFTQSKPVDATSGDPLVYGEYGPDPIVPLVSSVYQDDDTDWVMLVTAKARYAGCQLWPVDVIPGETYSNVKTRVRPEDSDGLYTMVIRDENENLIAERRDVPLTQGVWGDIEIGEVRIPEGVDRVIVRVAVTDPDPDRIGWFLVNWQTGTQMLTGLPKTTPGGIVKTLLEHAQAHADGVWLDVSFDEEEDSGSTAWPEVYSYQADGFAMYLSDVLDDMVRNFGCEWTITPKESTVGGKTHDLNLWVPEGAGTDRTETGPTLMTGAAVVDGQVVQRVPDFTRAVGWGAADRYVTGQNESTKAAFGQLTKFVDVEELADDDSVQAAVDAAFADEESNRPAGVAVLSGNGSVVPFVDFELGDTLVWQAPPALEKQERRVHTIVWTHQPSSAVYEVHGSRIWGDAAPLEALIRLLDAPKKRRRGGVVVPMVHPEKGTAQGAHIHLERSSPLEIPDDTDTAVEWDTPGDLAPRNFAMPSLPAAAVVIQEPGYYDFHIDLGLSPQATNPKVWATREQGGQEVQVWPSASDPGIWSAPYPATRFSNVAPAIPCLSGDVIRVYVRHSSGQAVDMTGAFAAKLVDRAGRSRLETPEVIEHVTAEAGDSTTMNITMSEPPEPGDVLVLVLVLMSRTLTGVSGDGWQTHGAFSERYVMSKVAGSDESDTVTITTANSGLIRYTHGALIRLRSSTSPVDVAANSGSSGEGHTAPSVDGVLGGLMLACWACQTSGLSVPDGLTELVAEHSPGGSMIAVGYRDTVGGATGDYLARLVDHSPSHATLGVQLAFGPRSN